MKSSEIRDSLWSWLQQCLLRRTPQDDPVSYAALIQALTGYLLIDLIQASASSSLMIALGMTLVDTLLMVVFAWVVLRVTGYTQRFVQTLTSLAGTGMILGLLALPLVQLAASAHRNDEPMTNLVLGWLMLLVWSVSVQAHIFRHALTVRYGSGLLLAGLHTVLGIGLIETLFPQTQG
ncbi:hypothetical protein DFR30_2728 [Thiogranum longum]|uniref:Yip1-like protein n=1 Tax=Thiogranum longum TaxID=1537524 RepID=A0A4R1HBQ8_9GAMM|nr:hypothetical protein [Thiogranum longum]TCK19417.1 hypothetical protein DFR30_2728 [Thiogranum longum]